jgi:prepilin-type N-terminal cleavage/methylation domain-containing protein
MGPIARGRLSRRARARATAQGGFTIIELLIAMVILAIIMTSLSSVLVSASHTEIDVNKRFQAQQNDRTGLDKLRREIHCANAVTQTDGTTSLVAGTAYSAITVTLPGICPTASGGVTTYATWCTLQSTLNTSDWALYRVATTTAPPATCATAGKIKWVDYLTTSTPFCLPSTTATCAGGVTRPTAATLSTVATAPSPASSGTSLTVASGTGSKFGAAPFYATVWPAGAQPSASNLEVVLVTAVAGDTFTITRAQQGSSARSILVGDQISTASLPMLHVSLPVNLNGPASTKQSYNLSDDIALKNGARS